MDQFGIGIALSADGSLLEVGANAEASAATGIGGSQTDNSAANGADADSGVVVKIREDGDAIHRRGRPTLEA